MDRNTFIDEWDRIMKEIHSGYYLYPSNKYVMVKNNGKGHILAQQYEFTYGDFIAFYIREDFKLIYVGGEHLRNIKELSIG